MSPLFHVKGTCVTRLLYLPSCLCCCIYSTAAGVAASLLPLLLLLPSSCCCCLWCCCFPSDVAAAFFPFLLLLASATCLGQTAQQAAAYSCTYIDHHSPHLKPSMHCLGQGKKVRGEESFRSINPYTPSLTAFSGRIISHMPKLGSFTVSRCYL